MTAWKNRVPRRSALPAAALAALLLAGCSSGHVGESWQCPLAAGGSCTSVAAADPAVPDAAGKTALGKPLWLGRGTGPEASAAPPCDAECGAGFGPFGWLKRLLGGDRADAAAAETNSPPTDTAVSSPTPDPKATPAEPAAVPAEADVSDGLSEGGDPVTDDLRTGEVVARIWIAPFVDAGGVYREASHVRVVLEPAGWRLGR